MCKEPSRKKLHRCRIGQWTHLRNHLPEVPPHVEFTIVDLNVQRVAAWSSDNLAIYKPASDEVVGHDKNLFYFTYVQGAIKEAGIIFASVNTPVKIKG